MGKPVISAHPLADIRHARGWTYADVARIVARNSGLNMASAKQKVYRWEHGVAVPEPVAQYALASELGVDRYVVDQMGWPGWLLTLGIVEPVADPWTGDAREVLTHLVEAVPMDRRGFLVMSGQALATAAGAALASVPAPARTGVDGGTVGEELVAVIRARTEHLWRLDDLLGGGACLAAAEADLRLTTTVLGRATYSGATERELYAVAASGFRFAGFAAFDAGRNAAAQRLWYGGLRAAHLAGNSGEAAYILSNLALQDTYVNQGRDALHLLDAAEALIGRGGSKTVLAMLCCWRARAHAVRGEVPEAAAALNRADDLYGRRRPENDPPWIYWMPVPSTTAEAGTAMLESGQPDRAEQILTAGLAGLPEDARRDRNLYLARLAEAQLADWRIDQAVGTARAAVDAGAGIDSARVAQRTRSMLDRFPGRDPRTADLLAYTKDLQAA